MSELHIDIPLRWSDLDAFGHVNNATFLTLLEEARIAALDTWFGGRDMLTSGVLVARQEIEYTAQLAYRTEPVQVRMWVSHIGASSFDVAYVLQDHGGERSYAVAQTTLVAFDLASQRPRRLTDQERAGLEAHLGDPAPMRRRQA